MVTDICQKPGIFLFVIIFTGLFFSPSFSASRTDHPFFPGETLTYEIKWSGIPVGQGTLSVLPLQENNDYDGHFFELRVKSNSFLDTFYKVRDKISSHTALDLSRSYSYHKKQGGSRNKRDVVVAFDWKNKQAAYSNFGRERSPVDILPGTLDPLSVLYFARLQDFDEIQEINVPVSDGKKCIIGKARIVKREIITVRSQEFDTYLLEPEIEEIGGVFDKSRDAKIRVWLTADSRKVPVKVESKVAIGSFTAELVSIQFH